MEDVGSDDDGRLLGDRHRRDQLDGVGKGDPRQLQVAEREVIRGA